jgi:two-component system, cell cycle sensor histidine kinase and response regulator CckA
MADRGAKAGSTGVPNWLADSLAAAGVGTWRWEIADDEVTWSAETYGLLGVDPGEHLDFGRYLSLVHPEDRAAFQEKIGSVVEAGTTDALWVEHRVIRPDGVTRWLECRGRVHRDGTGRPLRLLGTAQDVTERKDLEQAVHASEARLRRLVRNTPDVALQGYDLDGRVVFWNPASERLFGWTEAEAMGRTLDGLLHTPEEARVFLETLRQVHETGVATPPTEYAFRKKSGERGFCLSTIFRFSGPDEPPIFVCMDVDRTESLKLQQRVERAERLESLGRLAGGVAHDFNNLITAILGATSLALRELSPEVPGSVREQLVRIQEAGKQASGLTQQLLGYGRRQIVQPRPIDLDEHIGRVMKLLPTVVAPGVRIAFEPAPRLPPVRLDPSQLHQILFNLVINASDALPEGGEVRLSTSHRELVADEASGLPAGDWVVMTVEDDGAGMSDEVQTRLLEPFFTTKPVGKGTGLGLPTCYGIIRQNEGHLLVDSAPGRGTRIDVCLPAMAQAIPEATDPSLVGRGGTVLLVEDEAVIRDAATRALRDAGYDVLGASDAAEALGQVSAHEGPIQLLVSDLTLPGMDGRALANQLRVERPGLRVLFISGDPYLEAEVTQFGARFMAKPFTFTELVARVGHVLDEDV